MKNKILTVDEIANMSETDKINAYKNGYVLSELLEHSNILKLGTQNCPGSIQQGDTKNITVSLTSTGTLGYVYRLYMKKSSDNTFVEIDKYPSSGNTNETSHIFSHIFSEDVGSYIIKTEVIDSCIDGALLDESICPINVVEAGINPILMVGIGLAFLYAITKKK